MPDIYLRVQDAPDDTLAGLMSALELRAADPQQAAMREAYLADAALSDGTRALEVGCGTGAVTRAIDRWPGIDAAVGVDPSGVFLARARELAAASGAGVAFAQADAETLPFADASFDYAVFHTTLCHLRDPLAALSEARRVVREGGTITVFDGDYATATAATGPGDPLEACIEAFRDNFVHDPWLMRRLPGLMRAAGCEIAGTRSHGYVELGAPGFMLTSWIDMGADALARTGAVTAEEAQALKDEARRRVESGDYFAHVAYVSVTARTTRSR